MRPCMFGIPNVVVPLPAPCVVPMAENSTASVARVSSEPFAATNPVGVEDASEYSTIPGSIPRNESAAMR